MSALATTMFLECIRTAEREAIAILIEMLSNSISNAKAKLKNFRDTAGLTDLRVDNNSTAGRMFTPVRVSMIIIATRCTPEIIIVRIQQATLTPEQVILMDVSSSLLFDLKRTSDVFKMANMNLDSTLLSHVEYILGFQTERGTLRAREITTSYLSRHIQTANLIFSTVSTHSRLLF